jgi:hypothetical protein
MDLRLLAGNTFTAAAIFLPSFPFLAFLDLSLTFSARALPHKVVTKSSAAQTMAALVAQKFDLRPDRDRELIRQLTVFYVDHGYQIPPALLWGMSQRLR